MRSEESTIQTLHCSTSPQLSKSTRRPHGNLNPRLQVLIGLRDGQQAFEWILQGTGDNILELSMPENRKEFWGQLQ